MATTREQFIALRKSGMTPVQAKEEVMKTVTPVSPTTNANVAQLEANKAKVQSQIASWERPEVGTSATPQSGQTPTPTPTTPPPVTSSTTPSGATMNADWTVTPATPVTSTPVTPAPVEPVKTTVKPVTPKVEAPIDYTQAKGREQDIINNLNTFKAQNMTPEQIMKASDYQNATPEKKALIEPYLKQQVPTASAMYNNIVAKADIPDEQKTSLPYKIASNRYAKANMYSTMTPSQLSSEMTNSKLIQGSQAYEDLKAMNPKLVQDTENLRIVNGKKQNIFTYTNNPDGTPVKVNNLENTFAQDYIDNFGEEIKKLYAVQTPEQIRAIINTPDVIAAQDKATQIELSMNEIEKQMDNVDADVDAEMKWSGATGSRIALEKASRKDKLGKEYNSQLKNYTTYANKANNLITQNTTLYTTSQAQKLAQNNAMLPILQDQYKTEQAKAQAEADLKDPAIQIKNTIEEFAKLGIVAQWDLTSKIAEYETSWKTLPEYISGLRTQFMSKPEYKKYQELQAGQMSDAQKPGASQAFDLKKMWLEQDFQMKIAQAKSVTDNKWTKLDDWLYQDANGNIMTADEMKSAKLMWNSYITKQVWEEGGECGFYASRGTWMSATPGGNSKEARKQAFSDKTPQVGWMAFFGGAWYDPTYWHISIVTGVNADGTINVKESNYSGTGKVTERTVPASQVTGYYNNTPLAKWVSGDTGTQWEYTATEESWANNIMNGKAKISDITNKDNVDKGKVLQLMNQKTGWSTWTMQTNIQSGLDIVNSLINHPWFTDVVWLPSIFANPLGYSLPGTSARDFKAELKRMEAIGFLNMIPQMQGMGALSNAEWARLASAYSKLSDTGIGETEYKAELTRLKEWMEKVLKNMWATIPETPTEQNKKTVGGELNYSKYE